MEIQPVAQESLSVSVVKGRARQWGVLVLAQHGL